MASGSSSPPMLRIRRSSQSGTKNMAAAYAAVYSESSSQEYAFAGGTIDLSTMQTGDHIDIRVRKRQSLLGTWFNVNEVGYDDAQPTGHTIVQLSGIPDVYGIEVSMRQTAGVLRAIGTEFFDAKRLGLV